MQIWDFNIRHLTAFIATMEMRTLSAAAHSVNLSQPAITQGLAKLERQVGGSLFVRTPAGMEPTELAEMLAPRVQSALDYIGSKRVTMKQCRAFRAVGSVGSYADAARASKISEASLHRAVGDMAIALGYPLLERRGRGIILTKKGAVLQRRLGLARSELNAALQEMSAYLGREVGRIAIGAMPLSRARLLPAAISEFHKLFPQVTLQIVEGSYSELSGPLRDGDIDLMIGAMRDLSASDELSESLLFVDQPAIFARRDHPLSGLTGQPSLNRISAFEWIMPGGSAPLTAQWQAMFEAEDAPPPHVAIQCGSVLTIRQLLLSGDFLTLLSPDQLAAEIQAGLVTQIGDPIPTVARNIGMTVRQGWQPTALQHKFIEILHANAAK